MTEVRLDNEKPANSRAVSRSARSFCLPTGRLRLNLLAAAPRGIQNPTQWDKHLGNIGLTVIVHSAFVLVLVAAFSVATLYSAAANDPGGSMVDNEPKQGASPKNAAQSPSTGGAAASDPERAPPAPGTEKSAPDHSPLKPEDLRRLKEQARRPAPNSPAPQETDKNSSKD
jgi:cell division protein FtsN